MWNRKFGRYDVLPFSENLIEFVTVEDDVITLDLKSNLEIVQRE